MLTWSEPGLAILITSNLNEDTLPTVGSSTYPAMSGVKTFRLPWKAFHQLAFFALSLQCIYLKSGTIVDGVDISRANKLLELVVSMSILSSGRD